MKMKYIFFIGLIGLLLISGIMASSKIQNNLDVKRNDKNEINVVIDIPKTAADFWELTDFVLIDGDGEGITEYNWTTAVAEEWCSGTGTEGDPYLIENVTITVDNETYAGLTIRDSGSFFTLHNVTVTNTNVTGDGLYLLNIENGTVDGCNLLDNGRDGLLLENTNFTTLTDVLSTGNGDDGINMIDCVVNTITLSNFSENTDDGLYMANCTYNAVSSSYFCNNGGDGLCIEDSDLNNFTVEANDNNRGLVLIDSDECIITGGQFWDNTVVGVLLTEDDGDTLDNLIYNNLFDGNGVNGADNSSGNDWDNGIIGNDWDDYSGYDGDDNGIGDSTYTISGTGDEIDRYPLYEDGDEPVLVLSADEDFDDLLKDYRSNKEEVAVPVDWVLIGVIAVIVVGCLLVLIVLLKRRSYIPHMIGRKTRKSPKRKHRKIKRRK